MTLILCAIFFVSGASALIFETLWFHQAGIAFGNSVWASSLVLSGFMGGLALGSAAAVWRGDRLGPPVRTYAVLELIIAVSGVSLVFLLPSLGTLATPVLKPFISQPWVLNPLRLLLAFAFLLIPSTAMGLTLPLLTKALVMADPNFGRVLGRLYGWNTLGAVMGAVVAETHLVKILGIHGSALTAGSLNIIAAVSAALLYRHFRGLAAPTAEAGTKTLQWSGSRSWLGAAFLSGFALLALEVIWFRFLLLFVVGTSLSFAVMLAVVLAGISLGGLFAAFWLRLRPDSYRYAVAISVTSGLLCAGTYALFPTILAPFAGASIIGFGPVLKISIPLMFPVSFLSGIFFTFVGTALRRDFPTATATTGVLTFANTVGATLGAFAGGFLLLPLLGMEASFFLMALLYGAIGLLVFTKCQAPRQVLYPIGAVFVLSLVLFPWGAMFREHLMIPAGRWSAAHPWQVLGVREGVSETILYIEELIFGKRQHVRLVTNSYSMSSGQFNARRYMKLYAYLPVALHPDPRNVLLISYGVGSTAKALTDTESIAAIDVVDISRDILEMNSLVFPDPAELPLNDSRVRVHIEDGRYFLKTTDETYDLITGEPPPPPMAGVVNLYTREYFQLVRERLNEGGFVTYWLPLHSLGDGSAKAIIKAFLDVFPDASLWHGWIEDIMLVGTRDARGPVSVERFEQQWRDPRVADELKAVGLERPEQLGALFIGDANYLRDLTRDDLPLVDNFPQRILSDSALGTGSSGLYRSLTDTEAAQARFTASPLIDNLWPASAIQATLPYFEFQRIVNELIDMSGHPFDKSIDDLHLVITQSMLTAPIMWFMGTSSDAQRALESLSPDEREVPVRQYHAAARLISERRFEEALELLHRAEGNQNLFSSARMFRTYLLCLLQRIDDARWLALDTYPILQQDSRLESWWDLLAETCGVDPRS
jgi:predicted membrane-bound spermidine synthase